MKEVKLEIPKADASLLAELKKTRNPKALGFIVSAALATRDARAGEGKAVKLPRPTDFDLDKIVDPKSRARTARLIAAISRLTERKSISLVCAAAIKCRREARDARK